MSKRLARAAIAPFLVLALASGVLVGSSPLVASAHDEFRNGLPFPERVCNWEWQHVQVVTHYVDEFGNGPYPGPPPQYGPPLYPVYAWKYELVEVCEWRMVRPQIAIPHHHLTETQCTWVVKIGTTTLGVFGSSPAARAFAAALGLGAGTSVDIQRVCEENDIIVYLNVPPV
ncbi:MAG: hypothetical protein OXN44_14205 [Acidimicrobiaceae bacterium]|nr:hypothetical protein [Acidimicrobiaceae bacterium]